MSDSLQTHGLQHARIPCPSPTPRAYSNSCPLHQWCHPTILSSVTLFFFCPQSFPASGSFPRRRSLAGCSPCVHKQLGTTERLNTHTHTHTQVQLKPLEPSLTQAVPQPRRSVQFSRSGSVVSDFLPCHGPEHTRPPSPSPTPRAYSNSSPLSQWCHPTISSSVVPFSSWLQSVPASGSFQISQLFTSGGQSIGSSASASVLTMNRTDLL